MVEKHVLVVEDDQGRREFTLDSPVYSIGRDPRCDIRVISKSVSRRHATLVQLSREEGKGYFYRIVDGNLKGKTSENGLTINGCKLPAHDLENEDEIILGPGVQLQYHCYLDENDCYLDENDWCRSPYEMFDFSQ